MRAPKDKHESIDLFVRGRYGNNVPTWPSLIEALEKSLVSKFAIRYKGEPGVQGPALFGIPADSPIEEWVKLAEKWDEKRLGTWNRLRRRVCWLFDEETR